MPGIEELLPQDDLLHHEENQDLLLDPKARVNALYDAGCSIDFDPERFTAHQYLKSSLEAFRMANVYYDEKDLERAYILYTRFLNLLVQKLPTHPQAKTIPADGTRKKKIEIAFAAADKIKKTLLSKYDEEAKHYRKVLENRETERRENAEKLARIAAEEQKKKQLQHDEAARAAEAQAIATYSVAAKSSMHAGMPATSVEYPSDDAILGKPPPAKPSAVFYDKADTGYGYNQSTGKQSAVFYDNEIPASLLPVIDRTTKPKNDPVAGSRESWSAMQLHSSLAGLRTVIVPHVCIAQFMQIAESNTLRNTETCGILSGNLKQNKFLVTHVLIPKQSGTSDSCTTLSEEDIFNFQDKHDLLTLGWIHTHPSQTAFLSSVDMHTHCSYQLMLAEAIAVVVSPKFDEYSIFNLTVNRGLREISTCKQTGFHPHDGATELFGIAEHAHFSDGFPCAMIDLR